MDEGKINLHVVQKYDAYCTEILDKSGRTALYLFRSDENEWSKTKTEGVFFFYKRSMVPFYAFMILNTKLSCANQIEHVTKDLQLQLQLPFLLYKNEQGNIHSIWFYSEEDCERIARAIGRRSNEQGGSELKIGARKPIQSGVEKANEPLNNQMSSTRRASPPTFSNKGSQPAANSGIGGMSPGGCSLDILQMLTKAKSEMQVKVDDQKRTLHFNSSATTHQNNPRSIDLKDLFASSKNSGGSANKSVGPVLSSTSSMVPDHTQDRPTRILVELQRQMSLNAPLPSHPNHDLDNHQGAGMTVEQLERMLVNSSISSDRPVPNHSNSTGSLHKNQWPGNHNMNKGIPTSQIPGSHHGATSTVDFSWNSVQGFPNFPGCGDIKRNHYQTNVDTNPRSSPPAVDSDDEELMITPAMLSAEKGGVSSHSQPQSSPNHRTPVSSKTASSVTASSKSSSVSPLTKDQLKEALIFLIQDDDQFLKSIHTAYLKSFERRVHPL